MVHVKSLLVPPVHGKCSKAKLAALVAQPLEATKGGAV